MKELRIRYSRWMFFKSVVAPPFLFTAGVVAMVFVSGWLGGVCLAVSGAMLRWAVAKSFLADRPPLVFSPEGLLVAEMVNVGFTPWREVRALRVDVGANRLLCQVAKQGHWLAVVLDLRITRSMTRNGFGSG